jgi:glycosyltransferase involved in cell wall biosynthesis
VSSSAAGRPKTFGVLMTRNEIDLLRLNLVHHLQTSCDRILVVDNGSTDKSRTVLKRLAKKLPIDWTVDRGKLRQDEIVNAMAQEARAKGADWVIPLDTDEFWHTGRELREILAEDTESGAIEVSRIELIQARDQRKSSVQGVLRATKRVEHPLRGNQAIDDFMAGKLSMFETEPQPKIVFRTGPDVAITRGAHTGSGFEGPVTVAREIVIFHFPLRSRLALWGRAEQGRRIAEVSDNPNESVQNRFWQRMGEEGRLMEAWKAHSYEDNALDVDGRRVEVVDDGRLVEILGPLIRSPRSQLIARYTGRSW